MKDKTLEELLDEALSEIVARNSWQNMGHFHFIELAPNINTSGEIGEIGKLSQWRATVNYGDYDEIEWGRNFFGKTPKEAMTGLLEYLNSPN